MKAQEAKKLQNAAGLGADKICLFPNRPFLATCGGDPPKMKGNESRKGQNERK